MIRTQHIDDPLVSPLQLVPVVRQIGREVGIFSVRPHENAVFFVPMGTGTEPECPFGPIRFPAPLEAGHRLFDPARIIEGLLRKPAIMAHPEVIEVFLDPLAHAAKRKIVECSITRRSEHLPHRGYPGVDVLVCRMLGFRPIRRQFLQGTLGLLITIASNRRQFPSQLQNVITPVTGMRKRLCRALPVLEVA